MRRPLKVRLPVSSLAPRLHSRAGGLLVAGPAAAQAPSTSVRSTALQGFARNRDQPVRINADGLEVRDKDKVAVFSGNVLVTQGDTTLRSKDLLVYYEGSMNEQAGGTPQTGTDPAQVAARSRSWRPPAAWW